MQLFRLFAGAFSGPRFKGFQGAGNLGGTVDADLHELILPAKAEGRGK